MSNAFELARQQIERIKDDENRPTACRKCGTVNEWSEGQWRRHCRHCGIILSRSAHMPKEPIKCFACMDTGIIVYQSQVDDATGIYGAACDQCPRGQEYYCETKKGEVIVGYFKDCTQAPPIAAIIQENKRRAHIV
jgi:hypothetical protein